MTDSLFSIDAGILYFGTPVALLSTIDKKARANVAPMSSIFWLGHTAVLGMGSRSQTARNMLATRQVVISLASVDQVDSVDRLALTSGASVVPEDKAAVGYRYVGDKFSHAGLTPSASTTVRPARVSECVVSLEGQIVDVQRLADGGSLYEPRDDVFGDTREELVSEAETDSVDSPGAFIFSVHISRVWVDPVIQDASRPDRIDPVKWRPLIMSFQRFFGLGEEVAPSRLSTVDEDWYR